MKTNDELNIKIAKMLGYTVYHYDKSSPASCFYELWDADGSPVNPIEGERKTETEAWKDAPDWRGNIALTLALWSKYSGWTIEPGEGWHPYKVTYKAFKSDVTLNFNCSSVEKVAEKLSELFAEHVDPSQLEKERKANVLRDQIAALQEELYELDPSSRDD